MQRLTEETILLISVFKWFILASIVGVLIGGATAGFILLLQSGTTWLGGSPNSFLLLPMGLFLSGLLTTTLAPDAAGHGTEKVIEAVHRHSGHIKAKVVPVKLAATLLTLLSGGSAGKEEPCAQIGAGIASTMADIFCFNDTDRKKLVIYGISAGFAAVFGTPIAGAIFGSLYASFMGLNPATPSPPSAWWPCWAAPPAPPSPPASWPWNSSAPALPPMLRWPASPPS